MNVNVSFKGRITGEHVKGTNTSEGHNGDNFLLARDQIFESPDTHVAFKMAFD